jgi:hypothetical protein
MNEGKSIFSQLIGFLPDREFRRCVARYGGDRYTEKLSCWEQFLAMAFAQLTYRESLRDIEACLGAIGPKLYHMGIGSAVARSTLADANEDRDSRIIADFAQVLIRTAIKLYTNDVIGIADVRDLYALDSTTIDLCMALFPWARCRKHKAAVKMHTLLDLHGSIPSPVASDPALGKLPRVQPAGDCPGVNAGLLRDLQLDLTLTVQCMHFHVSLISHLPAPLPPRFNQRQSSICAFRGLAFSQLPPSIYLQLLSIALHCLTQIGNQMIAICDLNGRRRALSATICAQGGPITRDHLDPGCNSSHTAKLSADRTGSRSITSICFKSMSIVPYRCCLRQAQSSTLSTRTGARPIPELRFLTRRSTLSSLLLMPSRFKSRSPGSLQRAYPTKPGISHNRVVSRAFGAATAGNCSAKIFRRHSLFRHRKRRVSR